MCAERRTRVTKVALIIYLLLPLLLILRMTAMKMSPFHCGALVVLLLLTGSLRAEEGYGNGRPVGGGNFGGGGGGYAGGVGATGGGGGYAGGVGATGGGGGYAGGVGATGGSNNNNIGPSGGGAGGYGGSGGYNSNNNGGGSSAPGGSYDGGELGEPHPYSFQYEVKDPPSGNDYSQQESSDGNTVTGEYRVLLPDGRRQIVRYSANDATGYVADVQYEGEANFLQPTGPGGQQQQQQGGFNNNNNQYDNQGGYNNNQGGYNSQPQGGYNNQQGGYNDQQGGGGGGAAAGAGGYSYRR